MKACTDRIKDERRAKMAASYAVGVLVHTAFNNPKKFPKSEDFLKEKTRRVVTSLEEQRAILSKFAKRVG